jgi:hypothetical protein
MTVDGFVSVRHQLGAEAVEQVPVRRIGTVPSDVCGFFQSPVTKGVGFACPH